MREARVGAIMVKKDGKVAGIITDKDFVKVRLCVVDEQRV